jgi:hypothetical protein
VYVWYALQRIVCSDADAAYAYNQRWAIACLLAVRHACYLCTHMSCTTALPTVGVLTLQAFEKKFAKKKKAEDEYYKGRYNIQSASS